MRFSAEATFSESLRQEVGKHYIRVSLVEPDATATELTSHNRPGVLESIRNQFGQRMEAKDIADAIMYMITRPRHVSVNEMLIRLTEQERQPAPGRRRAASLPPEGAARQPGGLRRCRG
jgi:NADP-dependent 3-hydroxy acid dehydrogenase YdfG